MLIRTSISCVRSMKPSEAYNFLKRVYTQDRFMLDSDEVIKPLALHTLAIQNDQYYTRPQLTKWLNWVNKNIVLELGGQTYKTIDVRLRIAISMLDKIPLRHIDRLSVFCMLTENVQNEMNKIAIEDLPF